MHHHVDEKRLAESRDECAELFADAEGVLKLARHLESPLAQVRGFDLSWAPDAARQPSKTGPSTVSNCEPRASR